MTKSFVGTNVRCFLKNKMIKNPSQIPGNGKYTLLGQKKICGQKKILGLEKIRAKRGFFLTTQGRKIDAHFQIKFARNTV